MSLEYTLDFKADYKNTILKFLCDNKVDLSNIDENNFNELSLKFHTYQKNSPTNTIDEDASTNESYSSNMMIKWLEYLENEVKSSIDSIVEMAKSENVKIEKFPLHIELQLNIEGKSYQVVETNNNFNINI